MVMGAFLGGPVVAGIMAGINLNNIGQKSRAKFSFLLGVLGNVIFYAFILLVPDKFLYDFPHFFIPLIYTTITYIFIEILHHDQLFTAFVDGAHKKPFYKCILWGLSGLAITIFVIFLSLNLKYYSYNSYEFGNAANEIYYSKSISEDEVVIISEQLINDSYFQGDTSRLLYLINNGSAYKLMVIMEESMLFKPEINMDFRLLESVINRSGIEKKLEISLADKYMETEYLIN